MIKKVLLVVTSLLMGFQSYKLLIFIENVPHTSWTSAIFSGILLNLFVTGFFALMGFALPTQRLLPAAYYKVSNPRLLKSVYKFFNVNLFRKFLLATVWKNKNQRKKFFNGRADGIDNLIKQSKKSDFGHLFPFIILTVLSIYFITQGLVKLAAVTFILNFIFNWYPIILQRHHRMRISRLSKLRE